MEDKQLSGAKRMQQEKVGFREACKSSNKSPSSVFEEGTETLKVAMKAMKNWCTRRKDDFDNW